MNDNFDNQEYKNTSSNTSEINKEKIDIHEKMSKKKPKFMNSFFKVVALGMVFGIVVGASLQGYSYITHNNGSGNLDTNKNNDTLADGTSTDNVVAMETSTKKEEANDVSTVVENVMPAIVAINSTINNVTQDFFGRQYNQKVQGSGSGIIIGQSDTEILIATNNHVIDGATKVEIIFADDTTAPAEIKGTASGSDLAVLSVKISDLQEGTVHNIKIATLGDSDSIKLGDMAIAIGNALGYGQSITVGYVSALDREVTVEDVTLHVLQTDAAINPGNSGGALLNAKGEVIGINSVKFVDKSVESIGYAIPITDAIPIINQLMNRAVLKDSEKAFLGIEASEVTDVYSEKFNIPVGLNVRDVKENSAAEKAGIKRGDIIVALNNIKVETMKDLQDILDYTAAGSSGTITVKSPENGEYVEKTLDITFDKR